jgi:Glycosyl transferases group 1
VTFRQLVRPLVPRRVNFLRRAVNPARYLLDSARLAIDGNDAGGTTRTRPTHVVLVSDDGASTSEEQFTPFSTYRADLRQRLRLISVHLLLKDVLRAPKLILAPFDIVALKMSFRSRPAEALRVASTIRNAVDGKRVIYFDGDDDLCVQWPNILPYVDLYIKKHAFRDRAQYLRRYVGKTNLTDFVHRQFGFSFADDPVAKESGPVPSDQLPKIAVGYNLALDHKIMNLYKNAPLLPSRGVERNDIVFRGNVPSGWMHYLRRDIEPALRRLEGSYRVIIPNKRVTPQEYYREMMSSKISVSPFGYGEICWRDFEAVLCRSLLIKPSMDHVETNPDIFRPHQTYVPVRWDYSDLEEKCAYYLTHDEERERITAEAFSVLDNFYRNGGFMTAVKDWCERLDVSAPARRLSAWRRNAY